jgi:hypothetical protein
MADNRAGDELFLITMLRNPLKTVDSALRTGAALVPAALDALRAIPRIAVAMEKLVPALQAAQGSLDRIDRLGTFVAEELPETQHHLEELRRQLMVVIGKQREVRAGRQGVGGGLGPCRPEGAGAGPPTSPRRPN